MKTKSVVILFILVYIIVYNIAYAYKVNTDYKTYQKWNNDIKVETGLK